MTKTQLKWIRIRISKVKFFVIPNFWTVAVVLLVFDFVIGRPTYRLVVLGGKFRLAGLVDGGTYLFKPLVQSSVLFICPSLHLSFSSSVLLFICPSMLSSSVCTCSLSLSIPGSTQFCLCANRTMSASMLVTRASAYVMLLDHISFYYHYCTKCVSDGLEITINWGIAIKPASVNHVNSPFCFLDRKYILKGWYDRVI